MERGVALPPGDYRDDPTLTTTANNALALDMTVPADGRRPAVSTVVLARVLRHNRATTVTAACACGPIVRLTRRATGLGGRSRRQYGDREELAMTPASQLHVVRLRSGDLVRVRQVRPGDAPALARAYAHLGEQSHYRRFFTVMPELPEATLRAPVEVDHTDHEALVAVPLRSEGEIAAECRFVRLADQPDTAELGVTVVDAWQGRGLGSVLLARLSERALEVGIEYFTAEVLAENRAMLSLLPALGRVESESLGPVVTARIEIAEPPRQTGQDFLDLLAAAARGDIVGIPVLLRQLIRVPDGLAHIVRLPVSAVLQTLRRRS
jgi:RimJ/RimL family protein N-acetyltransferase